MLYLANAFSLQMVSLPAAIKAEEISPEEVSEHALSCIGHVDTASVVSSILGRNVPANRVNIHLTQGDILYVAQLTGGRLPEGATTLPEGFSLKFVKVTIA